MWPPHGMDSGGESALRLLLFLHCREPLRPKQVSNPRTFEHPWRKGKRMLGLTYYPSSSMSSVVIVVVTGKAAREERNERVPLPATFW